MNRTESSSGTTRSQGPITKARNENVRRLLIEGAWHHHRPYCPSADRRWDQASAAGLWLGPAGNRA
ncbi:transposase [Rhodococcus hoagii]|uniref:Transposase n=1 Tax=Rhodococcus hoagii TaxID=43767 RepID=A0AAE2W8B1_RHOHA|nr:transposase [Prescottella equi]MBM4542411.1 transposase [Prescottella equi]MBM4715834.1 transposase [Prescottella equi]NKS14015.1 transposase [Prescottella equi]